MSALAAPLSKLKEEGLRGVASEQTSYGADYAKNRLMGDE